MEGEGYKKRVSQLNVGNLIQTMWNFDNMEEPLIAGTQFDKGPFNTILRAFSLSAPHRNTTKEGHFMTYKLLRLNHPKTIFFLNNPIKVRQEGLTIASILFEQNFFRHLLFI